jgi:hypothetical protein
VALSAAALIIGLSACGNAATTSPGAAPAIIHIGQQKSAGSQTSAAGGAPVAEGAVDRMMPILGAHFLFDGSAVDLGATGPSWTLPAGAKVDTARVAALAKALGVVGEVRQMPADQGGGWMVGPADYSAPTVTVANDGMLNWWYNGTNTAVAGVGCAEAGSKGVAVSPPDSVVASQPVAPVPPGTDPCSIPAPPANVPTKTEAMAKATALFTALGYDPAVYDLQAYADQWSASVNGSLRLDGHLTQLSLSVGYGAEGAVQWASGTLAAPVAGDEYPLVSVSDAVARLNDPTGRWLWFGSGMYATRGGVAVDTAGGASTGRGSSDASTSNTPVAGSAVAGSSGSAVAPSPVSSPPGALPAPACDPTPTVADCLPPDAVPPDTVPVQPVDVHLTAVRLGLTSVWADDGTVWMLPAYVFSSADGGEYTVVAVQESFLDIPTATTVPPVTAPVGSTPVPVTTLTTDPNTSVVVVSTATTAVPVTDPGRPITTMGTNPNNTEPTGTGGGTAPSLPPPVSFDDAKQLAGMTVDQATVLAGQKGWSIRVSTLDGVPQAVTDDYRPDRVNVSVKDGMVFDIDFIG